MDSSSKSSSANRAYPCPEYVKVHELVPKKLQFSNYLEWKKQMLDDVITHNGLRGFIDGTVETPPETKMVTVSDGANAGSLICEKRENEDYVAWKKSDELVRQWILSRLIWSMKKEVSPFKTAKEVWEALLKLVEDIKTRLNHYLPLYKATIEGNWKTAEEFIEKEPEAVRARITPDSETALIVAVRVARRNSFVEKLVEKMSREDLAIGDDTGRTALHRAAGSSNFAAAKLLVMKNPCLVYLETHFKNTPLYYAAARGKRKMILWLMEVMDLKTKPLEGESGFRILYQLTISQLYDIALTVLLENPMLASFIPKKEEDLIYHPLSALANKPSSFESGNNYNFLQGFIYSMMKLENIPDYRRGGDPEAPPTSNNSGAANGGWGCAVKIRLHAMFWSFWKVTEKFGRILDEFHFTMKCNRVCRFSLSHQTYLILRHADNTRPKFKESLLHFHSYAKLICTVIAYIIIANDFINTVPLIKPIRETKELQDHALALLQFLCEKVIESNFSNADRIFWLPLEQATLEGIPEIVEKILVVYPYAVLLFENCKKQSIFQQAIVLRQEKVFNLIHQLEEFRAIVLSKWDASNNNALHLAGHAADPQQLYLKAGAAFQMQRELQWFMEVKRLVVPKNVEQRNKDNKTPAQVFSETHKDLVKEAERWMKDTANSCTVIASLIATVVFAAAIQVPGGNNDNGRPIFHQQRAFIIFGISNGFALFSSVASVVMFLSILTSRYAEEDFLFSLPNKFIIGLGSLVFSILCTMVAFGAILYLVFGENKGWILYPLVIFGCIPVFLFLFLQSPLLWQMIKSTYFSRIFDKRSSRLLL
ncbi:hypothetical protein RHSIM_Rhsim07G0243100 [Rhododendron simsii]|uniref:PGG domain-containing protein n=1 Tax=Rhododendron simsii TaxID=118357 RepID=A0A834GNM1_RHOSS|nr:hypothetical protein RHSIM_Rhsim07G0243100 [Rhododendron simsii]